MSAMRTLLIGAAALAAWSPHAAMAATVYGEAKSLGGGFARVYAELDDAGAPRAIGVTFDQEMLAGSPTVPNGYSRCFDKNEDGRLP